MKKNKMKRLLIKANILKKNFQDEFTDISGKVGVPILMYILGVPGIACIFIWLFFFKGK
jgi:hypothetical protein